MCEKLFRQPTKPLPMWLAALSFGRRVATLGRDRIGVGSSTSFPCGEFIMEIISAPPTPPPQRAFFGWHRK